MCAYEYIYIYIHKGHYYYCTQMYYVLIETFFHFVDSPHRQMLYEY